METKSNTQDENLQNLLSSLNANSSKDNIVATFEKIAKKLLNNYHIKKGEEQMKNFFKIEKPYTFEVNDLRCLLTVINFILFLIFGKTFLFIGLFIGIFGIIKDYLSDRRINSFIIHITNTFLYIILLIRL